jgi:hypothetical protein
LLRRILDHTVMYLRQNALAALALFVALGGTGYAAAGLHAHSASSSTPPLKAHGQVVAWAVVTYKGHVVAGGARPHVRVTGTGTYTVTWRDVPTFPKRKIYCAAPVSVDSEFSPTNVQQPSPQSTTGGVTVNTTGHVAYVDTFNLAGQPFPLGFEVALICPGT